MKKALDFMNRAINRNYSILIQPKRSGMKIQIGVYVNGRFHTIDEKSFKDD